MKTLAAILVECKKPLVLEEIEIPSLKAGQVLIEMLYSSVCHTQILECNGSRGVDKFLPHCLGHEGSGIVREIGAGVKKVKIGNPVILSWIKGSGQDVPNTQYQWDSHTVNAGAITTFSRYSVISENRLTVLPENFSMKEASILGCAIPTGFGTIFNTARPRVGDSIAIFGMGGIGLNLLQAAKLSNCDPIIAVDINLGKLELAKSYGATHRIHAQSNDPVVEIHKICTGGVDFAIDASGYPGAMIQLLHSVRNQGGTAIVVGNAPYGEKIQVDPGQLNQGKKLLGTWGGDNVPDRDFPRYCKLVQSGKLKLDIFLSKTYRLVEINKAIEDLSNGNVVRPLIDIQTA